MRLLHDTLRLRAGLLEHQLRLPCRLLPAVGPELLGRHQRFVHRPLPLPIAAQLLLRALEPLVGLHPVAHQPLQLLGEVELELIHLGTVVPPHRPHELLGAHIERGEAEDLVAHRARSPNRIVPSRTIVAPSSTAVV